MEGRVIDKGEWKRYVPALAADVGALAAGSDVVVICQINIKDQLTFLRLEAPARVGVRRTLLRIDVIHGADIDF